MGNILNWILFSVKRISYKFISIEAIKQIEEWDIITNNNRNLALRNGFRLAERKQLLKFKKSDTFVILGSGSSINELSQNDWIRISQHDSIGFNWFFCHPFVPDYYHMELMEEEFPFFKKCYSRIKDNYSTVPFMVNSNHLSKDWNASTLNFINELTITTPERYSEVSESAFREILRYYYRTKRFLNKDLLIHPRASIIVLISFAVLLGYKKIILAGIDLKNSEPFYNDPINKSELTEMVSTMKREKGIKSNTGMHPTADKNLYPKTLTIDKIIKIYKEEVLDFHNIEIFVTSKKSMLYPEIPSLASM